MPTCPDCHQDKPLSGFYKSAYQRNQGYCKSCAVVRNHYTRLKRVYGVSREEYDAKFAAQNGVCAICGQVDPRGWRLTQDHNHETGQNRALLCILCNSGIGQFFENTELMFKAIRYLKEWQEKERKDEQR